MIAKKFLWKGETAVLPSTGLKKVKKPMPLKRFSPGEYE